MIIMSPGWSKALAEPPTRNDGPVEQQDLVSSTGDVAPEDILTPRAVAALLFVDRRTVSRWAKSGKLACIRTPGGQRRYLKADVLAIRAGAHEPQVAPATTPLVGAGDRKRRTSESGEDDLATAVVADAVAIALEAEAAVTAEAVVQIAAAVAVAAEKAAEAAERARTARTYAAEKAAQTVARDAVLAAVRVQEQADVAASQVARAAATAVEELLAPDANIEPTRMAALLAEVVQAAAEATAIDTSLAASVVATAVDAAAAGMARTTSASEDAYDSEVIAVADALRGLTTVTARQAATDSRGRAEGVAVTALEAAAALRVPSRCGENQQGAR